MPSQPWHWDPITGCPASSGVLPTLEPEYPAPLGALPTRPLNAHHEMASTFGWHPNPVTGDAIMGSPAPWAPSQNHVWEPVMKCPAPLGALPVPPFDAHCEMPSTLGCSSNPSTADPITRYPSPSGSLPAPTPGTPSLCPSTHGCPIPSCPPAEGDAARHPLGRASPRFQHPRAPGTSHRVQVRLHPSAPGREFGGVWVVLMGSRSLVAPQGPVPCAAAG